MWGLACPACSESWFEVDYLLQVAALGWQPGANISQLIDSDFHPGTVRANQDGQEHDDAAHHILGVNIEVQ